MNSEVVGIMHIFYTIAVAVYIFQRNGLELGKINLYEEQFFFKISIIVQHTFLKSF